MSLDPASLYGEGPGTCLKLYTGDGHAFYLAIEAVESHFDVESHVTTETVHFKPITISGEVAEQLQRRFAGESLVVDADLPHSGEHVIYMPPASE